MKKIVVKLDLPDGKAKQKALKTVSALRGIDSIAMDMKEKKLTVTGLVDPISVVSKLRKHWPDTSILLVGPAKPPEKPAPPPEKKDDPAKSEPNKPAGDVDAAGKKEDGQAKAVPGVEGGGGGDQAKKKEDGGGGGEGGGGDGKKKKEEGGEVEKNKSNTKAGATQALVSAAPPPGMQPPGIMVQADPRLLELVKAYRGYYPNPSNTYYYYGNNSYPQYPYYPHPVVPEENPTTCSIC